MDYEAAKTIVAEWLHREPIPDLIPRRYPSSEITPKGSVLAIVGARRAGKTFLMYQMASKVDVVGDSSLLVDFEDYRLTSLIPGDMELLLRAHSELAGRPATHLFLDEVHRLPEWSRVIRTLCNRRRYHIVISGSNAKLLEREISTELRGRHTNRRMFPLSFAEYLDFTGLNVDRTMFYTEQSGQLSGALRSYLETGGFPEVVLSESNLRRSELLTSYFRTVFFNDLVERFDIQATRTLQRLMEYFLHSFSTIFSISKFTGRLKSEGISSSKKTVSAFLSYLEEAFFIHTGELCDPSVHKRRMNPRKVYLMDHGFAAIPLAYSENLGLLLENVVAVELLRRGHKFCYYKGRGECDFITGGDERDREAIQVCWALNETNRQREMNSLLEAGVRSRTSSCTVITANDKYTFEKDGRTIDVLPAWQWLLQIGLSDRDNQSTVKKSS